MPDYPYVYPEGAARPIEPGGTRLRFFRRRPRTGDEPEPGEVGAPETVWGDLLDTAVRELNDVFRQTGAPYSCRVEEDEAGFVLRVIRADNEGSGVPLDEVEEVLEPADLPVWLARLRVRLGLLIDERV